MIFKKIALDDDQTHHQAMLILYYNRVRGSFEHVLKQKGLTYMLWKQMLLRSLYLAFWLCLAGLLLYGLVHYLFPLLLGGLFSLLIYPIIKWVEQRFRLPYIVSCILTILSLIISGMALVIMIGIELLQGVYYLSEWLPRYLYELLEKIIYSLQSWIQPILNKLNHYMEALPNQQHILVEDTFAKWSVELTTYFSSLLEGLFNGLVEQMVHLPGSITIFIFSLLCTFFICKDWDRAYTTLNRFAPFSISLITQLYIQIREKIGLYIKAQLLLIMISFVIILTGLLIFQIPYPLTIALLIAVIDLLPVVGTGLIFIPWSLYLMMAGDYGLAIGLFVLYAIVLLQRQILEPKIIANALGIHPLLTLLTIYLGFRLFGVIGIWFGPLLLFIGKASVDIKLFHMLRNYIKHHQFTIDKT